MLNYLIGFVAEYFNIIMLALAVCICLCIYLRSFRRMFIVGVSLAATYLMLAILYRNGIGYAPLYTFTMNIIYSCMLLFSRIVEGFKVANVSLVTLNLFDAAFVDHISNLISSISSIETEATIAYTDAYIKSLVFVKENLHITFTKLNNKIRKILVEEINISRLPFVFRC